MGLIVQPLTLSRSDAFGLRKDNAESLGRANSRQTACPDVISTVDRTISQKAVAVEFRLSSEGLN